MKAVEIWRVRMAAMKATMTRKMHHRQKKDLGLESL